VAIYHLHVKAFSRASGRSATAAAAYRAGERIVDTRTREVHDYTKKRGIEETALVLPGGGTENRSDFWNRVELHHKRGDAVVAREVEVSLPAELTREQRRELAVGFARELSERYGVAADVAIHQPSRKGDDRNHHAHIMLSACRVSPDGTLGKKAAELDPIHCQRHKLETVVSRERSRWAELANSALERHRHAGRVDHRTLEAQGIDREPTRHRGPGATAIERRTQEPSRRSLEHRVQPIPSRISPIADPIPNQEAALAAMKEEGARIRREQLAQKAAVQAAEQAKTLADMRAKAAQTLNAMRERAAQLKREQEQQKAKSQISERVPSHEITPPQPDKKDQERTEKELPKPPEKAKGKDREGPER
jgi:ATP-dependent exoDNAse (exonuclease V) alpha subunit